MGSVRRRAAPALVLTVALVTVAAARADKIALNVADQTTAHAIVVKAADLGSGWHGGARKPELSSPRLDCASLRQHEPVLVITGAAESEFSNELVGLSSEAEVVRDASTLAADFRFGRQSGLLACVRAVAPKVYGKKAKLLSIVRIRVPRITPFTAGFRMVLSLPYGGGWVSLEVDRFLLGKGRTALTLTASAAPPDVARSKLRSTELRLLRLMAARTPPS